MKKIIPFLLLISFLNTVSQNLQFKQFKKSDKASNYKSYLSKDSICFRKNDEIRIGNPSGLIYKSILIFDKRFSGYVVLSATEHHLLQGKNCKIFSISVAKKKKNVYRAFIQVRNDEGNFFSIDIEDAIESNEISFRLSEDEVLELLKKEKEKMEFGIITKDEFEKRKKEILKRKKRYN